ncbi:glucosylglycerol-phosphate synthase [Lusitaniella coriacea LEGE 07157]|uniref:Glucosylglycerol-phosphate synthase n=1 Tax=Lusitaniella coriacea LEGE 07157 TaxID=945747 RepID=A0A8J7DYA1_9CYAN|nr:glucosylglycerol-phosphate synthase [Lusitaniella coriacea]MBE9117601.1 glucosylglycerol-phosphate synthase [Lusitaniella coriacea LEGE 07157]
MKSSLVILYHREPYDEVVENGKVFYREKKSPNGILPTLKSFFANAERSTWVAWKQVTTKQRSNFQDCMTFEGLNENCVVRRIPLAPEQVKNFYHITSKEAFWPILHSFPWQFAYDSSDWENFKHINQLFAKAACEDAADDALIWVHDYNLWLAPYYIRQQMPHVNIAFFHHTPFPSADIFNILPWREAIVDSLLACDLCGFHIPRYVENFVSVARSVRDVEIVKQIPVDPSFTPYGTALAEPRMTAQLRYNNRTVELDAFPVGTNPSYIRSIVEKDTVKERVKEIRADVGNNKLIVSAGRVDYVKGTKEMLLSYERLLNRKPDLHGKVNLIVTAAAPAQGMRVYKTAQSEIERLVGKINGRFAKLNWTPILLFTAPLDFEELMAVYRAADIAWITPLRDGLNLVAKEFVVTHADEGGVLILSEFAGSAVELPSAVLTNPYSFHHMDEAIDRALTMPEDEQKERMGQMYRAICRYDVQQWANHMFREAKAAATNATSEENLTLA